MDNNSARWLRFLPMLLVMATIFFLSSLSGDEVSIYMPSFANADKVAHCTIYAALAATAIFAFSSWRRPVACALLAFIISALYGASDEWHQSFVAGRTMDFFDFLADSLAAAVVVVCWLAWRKAKGKAIF